MLFRSKDELNQFLAENNIKTIDELLNSFNLKFQKHEYAMHTVYSNNGNEFKACHYWYSLSQGESTLTKEAFIKALKSVINSLNFSIYLEKKLSLAVISTIENIKSGQEYYLTPYTKLVFWPVSGKYALSRKRSMHGLKRAAMHWKNEELTEQQAIELLESRVA